MMKRCAATMAGLLLLGVATQASAQTDIALSQAKARLACGAGTVVSSQFLPNGTLQVTCAQPQPQAQPTVLQGTTLGAPAAVGLVAVATVLVIATGGSNPGTTTTTTTAAASR